MKKLFFYSALCLLSPLSFSMGMGDIQVNSFLDQKLKAEIPLIDVGNVPLTEIKVGLASDDEYSRIGLTPMPGLSTLSFNVIRDPSGMTVISITSPDKITQPYLQLLVDLAWSKGQLYRVYTLLLDPVGYNIGGRQSRGAPLGSTARGEGWRKEAPQTTAYAQGAANNHPQPTTHPASLPQPTAMTPSTATNPESTTNPSLTRNLGSAPNSMARVNPAASSTVSPASSSSPAELLNAKASALGGTIGAEASSSLGYHHSVSSALKSSLGQEKSLGNSATLSDISLVAGNVLSKQASLEKEALLQKNVQNLKGELDLLKKKLLLLTKEHDELTAKIAQTNPPSLSNKWLEYFLIFLLLCIILGFWLRREWPGAKLFSSRKDEKEAHQGETPINLDELNLSQSAEQRAKNQAHVVFERPFKPEEEPESSAAKFAVEPMMIISPAEKEETFSNDSLYANDEPKSAAEVKPAAESKKKIKQDLEEIPPERTALDFSLEPDRLEEEPQEKQEELPGEVPALEFTLAEDEEPKEPSLEPSSPSKPLPVEPAKPPRAEIENLLALAEVYMSMQDYESAEQSLEEIYSVGNEEQKSRAQAMLEECKKHLQG